MSPYIEVRNWIDSAAAVAFGSPLNPDPVPSAPTKMSAYQSFLPSKFSCSRTYWPLELSSCGTSRFRSDHGGFRRGNEIASEAIRAPSCSLGFFDWPGFVLL
ncbi:hypothetical protein [Kribbella swartbergensis]